LLIVDTFGFLSVDHTGAPARTSSGGSRPAVFPKEYRRYYSISFAE